MASSALARRYAGAYFEIAAERDQVDDSAEELRTAASVLGSAEARERLQNPKASPEARLELAQSLVERMSEATGNLVHLLVERHRLDLLDGIVEEFGRLRDRRAGIVRAEVVTAVPVTPALRTRLERALREQLRADVRTEVRQDPDIVGGLVIRVGDRVVDASIRTKLQKLQAALA